MAQPLDVNDSGQVNALDALLVINGLNTRRTSDIRAVKNVCCTRFEEHASSVGAVKLLDGYFLVFFHIAHARRLFELFQA